MMKLNDWVVGVLPCTEEAGQQRRRSGVTRGAASSCTALTVCCQPVVLPKSSKLFPISPKRTQERSDRLFSASRWLFGTVIPNCSNHRSLLSLSKSGKRIPVFNMELLRLLAFCVATGEAGIGKDAPPLCAVSAR